MKGKKSRLALVGVLALAISVTVGLASGSVADAKKKTKNKTAVVSKTVNTAIPDHIAGGTARDGQLDVPLSVGKKFKGKVVGADGVSVTFQTTGDSANSASDLVVYVVSPKGRLVTLNPNIGNFQAGQSVGPLTLSPNSSVGLCAAATPPCANPLQTLNRPFVGTAGDTGLANFHGTQVQGTWKVIFLDTANTKTSIVNSVKLAIASA
jgi:hypothetical protein